MEKKESGQNTLERLSSPEQLDQLLQVTSPRGWMALGALLLMMGGVVAWMFLATLPTTVNCKAILMRRGSVHRLPSPQTGMLKEILVKTNEVVEAGQVVARVQSQASGPNPLQLTDVKAAQAGIVAKKLAKEGDIVSTGETLLILEPDTPTLELLAYMPLQQARSVRPGMLVQISPSTAPSEVYGFLWGKVRMVASFPAQSANMLDTLGNDELVKYFLSGSGNGTGSAAQAVPLEIRADLVVDASTTSGYSWSSRRGPNFTLGPETLASAAFVLGRERPITLLIPDAIP